jgi:hypothetical protein
LDLNFDGIKLDQVPLVHQLFEADIYLEAKTRQLGKTGSSHHYTVVTPKVSALSMILFQQCFKMVKPPRQEGLKSYNYPMDMGEIHGTSPIIKWIGKSSAHSVYNAVRIGKTIYKVLYLCSSLQILC